MIKVVTFDLDDTLWDITPVLARAEAALFDWLGSRCPAAVEGHTLHSLRAMRMALVKAHPELTHQITRGRHLQLLTLLQQAGLEAEAADALAHEAMGVFLRARHEVELFDAVEEVLAELQQRYVLGVLTNGNADIYRLPLGRYFSFAYSAENLDSSKPMPLHFERTLQQTGAAPSEIVHVGDHAEHDIAGAQALGWRTIWFNRHGERWPGAKRPDAIVCDIREVPAAIRAMQQRDADQFEPRC